MNLNEEEKQKYYLNLLDAGCTQKEAKYFLEMLEVKSVKELKKAFEKHRDSILNQIHINQRKIDCFDFFVYQITQKDKENEL